MGALRFTDTHCHLTDAAFSDNLSEVLQAAEAVGVRRFVVPATVRADWAQAISLTAEHIFPAAGIHPWFVAEHKQEDLTALFEMLSANPNVMVGEIGLDYRRFRQPEMRALQCAYLAEQLLYAQRLSRPVLLHNVGATHDLVRLLKQTTPDCGGVVHAFSGSVEEARQYVEQGLFLGIGTLLLNPKARKLREVASTVPLSALVLETDSPFMWKDGVNVPANVCRVAEVLADLRGIPLQEVSEYTEQNVEKLLPFRQPVCV